MSAQTLLMAVCVAAVSACGSTAAPLSTGPPSSAAPTSGDQTLKAAVEAYSNDYLGGKGSAAFSFLSQRCQQSVGEAQLSALASAARSLYGVVPLSSFTVVSDDGSKAVVSYTYPTAKLNQSNQPWISENGEWKDDGC
ncbi:MAG: hypothetical protein ACRDZY_11250 [Acidimicrobiales bacterium]